MKGKKRLNEVLEELSESAWSIWEYDRVNDLVHKEYNKAIKRGVDLERLELYEALFDLFEELDLRTTQDEKIKHALEKMIDGLI